MNYTMVGEERYLKQKNIKSIIKKLGCDAMNVVYFDAKKTSAREVVAECISLPFFHEHKVVVLSNADFLTSKGLAYDEDVLLDYLNQTLDSTTLIIVCDNKMDARKKIGKQLTKTTTLLKFETLNEYNRDQFLNQEIKKLELEISSSAYRELKLRLGFDLEYIIQSLTKLSVYDKQIDLESVKALISKPLEDDVFQLSNALLDHQLHKALKLFSNFQSLNIEVIALIALLASNFRFLSQVKSLSMMNYSKQEITSYLGAHPFRVELTLNYAKSRDLDIIQATLEALSILDQEIKSGKIEKNLGFELFLLQYCN